MRLLNLGLLLILLTLMTGCGPSTTTANGKVTYQGKLVVWGSITLVASDGSVFQAGIEPDGTFTIPKMLVGTAKVGVESSAPPAPGGRGGDARGSKPPPLPPAGAWFPIPDTLNNPAKSGVTVEVKSGQPTNIDLK
jgi:hypothetical protein